MPLYLDRYTLPNYHTGLQVFEIFAELVSVHNALKGWNGSGFGCFMALLIYPVSIPPGHPVMSLHRYTYVV